MSKQTTWSERAKCYDAKHTENGTILYYVCLITGKKTELKHPDKLALSAYIGHIGALVQSY
jgi:hypothetical protein